MNRFTPSRRVRAPVCLGPAARRAAGRRREPREPREPPYAARARRVAAADEFFLHVQTPDNPQYVGGVAILDTSAAPPPTVEALRGHLAERLPAMSRLTRRLRPAGRARHHRWVAGGQLDLAWHVQETALPGRGGRPALDELVATLGTTPLDPDRPPWRIWLVHGPDLHRTAVVVIVHHAVADGLGVVALLRNLLDAPGAIPPTAAGEATPRPACRAARRAVAPAAHACLTRPVAVVQGLVSLGRDAAAPPMSLCGPLSRSRAYLTSTWSLPRLRACADRLDVRMTDLLLAAVGQAAARAVAATGEEPAGQVLRAAVPVTLSLPGPAGPGVPRGPGNRTAALRLDVPLGPMPAARRAEQVGRAARGRRTSAGLLASTAAVRLMGVLPPSLHRAAVRSVYQARFFTAIVSNMRGAPRPLELLGRPLLDVHPIVPLAARVPISVGALGWNDRYCVAATVDPALVDPALVDPAAFAAGLNDALAALSAPYRAAPAPGRTASHRGDDRATDTGAWCHQHPVTIPIS
ncbi:wax ester/triacylglycerol synthase domain-containing protein [Parafrankia elaeagni]|uniref:wax ester/triacylglycerol synthase domain-containing protein n=1 Tax=Parafrankia elaeagni TaxID=222534 RepID=UPI00039CD9E4|nr:wax ester/triacylglycerol synthase domain-containing protein [Parafrankia elaeagni]